MCFARVDLPHCRGPPRSERALKYFIEHVEQTKALANFGLEFKDRGCSKRAAIEKICGFSGDAPQHEKC